MTIFLCILALLALWASPTMKADKTGAVVAVMACWTILVLGLATLAVITWWPR